MSLKRPGFPASYAHPSTPMSVPSNTLIDDHRKASMNTLQIIFYVILFASALIAVLAPRFNPATLRPAYIVALTGTTIGTFGSLITLAYQSKTFYFLIPALTVAVLMIFTFRLVLRRVDGAEDTEAGARAARIDVRAILWLAPITLAAVIFAVVASALAA